MKKILALGFSLLSTSCIALSINAVADARKDPEYGKTSSEIRLTSNHSIFVTNPLNHTIGWQYIYHLCTEAGCVRKQQGVNVEPHKSFSKTETMEAHISYFTARNYKVWARTELVGDVKEYSDDKTALNTIYVSK